MTGSSAKKSKSKSPSGCKKLQSASSSPEVNSHDYFTREVERFEDFSNSEKCTRRRIVSESKERKQNEKCETGRFPGRRRSIHLTNGEEEFSQKRPIQINPVNEASLPCAIQEEKKINSSRINGVGYTFIIGICLVLLFSTLMASNIYPDNSESNVTIDLLKQKFPKQKDLLWKAVASGLNDTVRFQQPSSYILLYQAEAGDTVKKLIKELSHYAVCYLSNCNNIPIELNRNILNSKFVGVSDYGVIISQYKKDLEDVGVMVIENLDEMPENYALAFHSFCDKISPLVQKSAFFFTIKVDKVEESQIHDLRKVEKLLKEKWHNIEDDIFHPLFTRLSEMPIWIYPE
ncbi:hypothetical protein WA026_007181 [Henosepilachna vigintioctopunctata]|uniref:Uncharacterized protein n=1 Tax=Henosepilachna vigintioctopunctata TaxID=420089 RepID=A0AAW1V9L1_9CUCU